MRTTLQERIVWALKEAGINQSELARRAKIARATVSLWTLGVTKSIDGQNLTRASRVLHVDPHWLATGEGSPQLKTLTQIDDAEKRSKLMYELKKDKIKELKKALRNVPIPEKKKQEILNQFVAKILEEIESGE